jgi:predicted DNA-binding transcriptional regulator YafY
MRTFRLDRVNSVTVLDTTFEPPADFDALDYMLSSFQAIPDRWTVDVLLEVPLEAARLVIPRSLAPLVQTAHGVRLRASIRDLNHMARTLIALGCPMKAINPPELRSELLNIAARITEFAGSDES